MNAEEWIAKFVRDWKETFREVELELQKPHERFNNWSRMQVLYIAALVLSVVFGGPYAWLNQAYWPVLIPLGIGVLGLVVKIVSWAKMNFGGPSVFLEEPPKKKVGLLRWAVWIAGYLAYEGVWWFRRYVEDCWREALESSLPSWVVIEYGLFHLAWLIICPVIVMTMTLVMSALEKPYPLLTIASFVASIPGVVAYEVLVIANAREGLSTLEAYFARKYAFRSNN